MPDKAHIAPSKGLFQGLMWAALQTKKTDVDVDLVSKDSLLFCKAYAETDGRLYHNGHKKQRAGTNDAPARCFLYIVIDYNV